MIHDFFHHPKRGFVLVITLSLMILLTVLAVGMLSLSAIALRATGQGNAMAIARSNARLALMLAIGDLQKNAGPDQSVTARADVLDENIANPQITGVWKSWEIKATAPPSPTEYEKTARDAKFLGWLVSGTDPVKTAQIAYAKQAPASAVTLWGQGTLGAKPPANSLVRATKVPLVATSGAMSGATLSTPTGALAWAVLDEGVKVRINTRYADNATSTGMKTAELGAGERPGVEFIAGLNKLERRFFKEGAPESAKIDKGITRLNFALAGENLAPDKGVREALMPLTHDFTTQSFGLFTDTARGGLKQDFHLLTNTTSLPAVYSGKGVYVSRLGMTAATAPSDPAWASLQQFARLYRDTTKISNSGGVPVLKSQTPSGWAATTTSGTTTTFNRTPPPGVVLLPTIVKVQVVFSLIGRDIYDYPAPLPGAAMPIIPDNAPGLHGAQCDAFRNTKYKYDLEFLYTPVVTLHNPYNVALEFYNMRVEFAYTPFAMQVFRNGIAQSTGLVPVETMYAGNEDGRNPKTYGIDMKTKSSSGSPDSPTIKLMPGEVKLFSPYIPPTHSFRDEYTGGRQYAEWYVGEFTRSIISIPGWRGDGIGYCCDWLAGGKPVDGDVTQGRDRSTLGLARDDQIHVEFAPLSVPSYSNNKFVVRITASPGAASTPPVIVNAIEINYDSETGLQDLIIGKGKTLRYPKTGELTGIDMVDHATVPMCLIKNVKPFALLTVQAKTTSGGRDASGDDGRLATKPWCFGHAVGGCSSQKISSEHPANYAYEFDLVRLDNGTSNLLQVDQQDRSNFITGHTGFNGTKFGALYDIPLAPVQTLAGLNGANPGGSSGYLPRFAQPIGNSWAHPLIAPTMLLASNTNANMNDGKNYLDHSFLLNLALYDGFYFSGLGDQTGPFCTPARTSATLASNFAAGTPLDDPRVVLHPPDGKAAKDFAAEVAKPTAYTNLAAWQMMEGAFNINSTSVPAWKAMLASIHDSQALYNSLNKANSTSALTALTATAAGEESRISRFRLPASKSAADGGDPADAYWLGPREFSDAELQTLAENIVKQVRLRGPFLSMAEFVNRRLGSDEKAQRGALQQAIDDSNLNQAIANAAGQGGAGFEIPVAAVGTYKYANAAAGAGSSYQGAPGYLTQADLLNVLGNAATARSDTFTIRGYGEARDATGKILARATCEAVVQRFPEWLDPADPVETAPAELKSRTNKTFGRRFVITLFRWLNPHEI
jgi:hypothetical protein